jgi:hypothetical protein
VPSRCGPCGKLSFRSRGAAQRFLRSRKDWPDFDAANLFPYRCRQGNGWHVGHHLKTQREREKRELGWRYLWLCVTDFYDAPQLPGRGARPSGCLAQGKEEAMN